MQTVSQLRKGEMPVTSSVRSRGLLPRVLSLGLPCEGSVSSAPLVLTQESLLALGCFCFGHVSSHQCSVPPRLSYLLRSSCSS